MAGGAWARRPTTDRAMEAPEDVLVDWNNGDRPDSRILAWRFHLGRGSHAAAGRRPQRAGPDSPGLESAESDRSAIGLRDHVDAVIEAVNAISGPVTLVGHSGGGAIPRGRRFSAPSGYPSGLRRQLSARARRFDQQGAHRGWGGISLPDSAEFDQEDLTDLDDDLRSMFRAIAVPEPTGVARDEQTLMNDRRYGVPVTVIACEFSADSLVVGSQRARISCPNWPGSPTWKSSTFPPATGLNSLGRESWRQPSSPPSAAEWSTFSNCMVATV